MRAPLECDAPASLCIFKHTEDKNKTQLLLLFQIAISDILTHGIHLTSKPVKAPEI